MGERHLYHGAPDPQLDSLIGLLCPGYQSTESQRACHLACAFVTGERWHKCTASSASNKFHTADACHSVVWGGETYQYAVVYIWQISLKFLTSVGGKGCSLVEACLVGDSGVGETGFAAWETLGLRHLSRFEEICRA